VKIFLDTANLEEIREGASLGLLDGVTTNPSLIAKEGADFRKRIVEICEIVQGPVSAEVTCTDTEGMCRQGRELAKIHSWVVGDAAKAGADVATRPFKAFERLFKHPLTDKGQDKFLKDWEKLKAR